MITVEVHTKLESQLAWTYSGIFCLVAFEELAWCHMDDIRCITLVWNKARQVWAGSLQISRLKSLFSWSCLKPWRCMVYICSCLLNETTRSEFSFLLNQQYVVIRESCSERILCKVHKPSAMQWTPGWHDRSVGHKSHVYPFVLKSRVHVILIIIDTRAKKVRLCVSK